jgi:polyhydroxyalkanoate synthase subunit PhaC
MQKLVDPTSTYVDASQALATNPDAVARNMLKLMQQSSAVMAKLVEKNSGKPATQAPSASEMADAAKLWANIGQHWMQDPGLLTSMQTELTRGYFELWQHTTQKMLGQSTPDVAKAEPGDNRFKDADWADNPYFDFWKQSYLLTSQWATKALDATQGLDERTRAQAQFALKQMLTAMSPSNYAATNPEVVRETLKSQGANLVAGMENLAADLARSGDTLKISQTDTTAFEVGRNVATTPGKVVFQNELFQLIQYTPTTPKVHEVPFVIVPPWINKFYILDLTAEKSFVKYVVDQGFTTFLVSWVNPDAKLAGKTFEDYMTDGLMAAADAAKRECKSKKVNILGYCIGGTLLATALGVLAAKRQVSPFNSATFLVAQTDFTKAGDLKLFIDEQQLQSIATMMEQKGYLDGANMATVFNMLRPKDLIWPYIVNNYMLGKKPPPFDLLYWNQDSTRLPAANHNFYLREFYHENKLALGKLKIADVTIDLSKVKTPVFELATREDHISPPKSVYTGAKMFGGPVEFVLAGSGHIAGVVSAPGKTKYPYWVNKKPLTHADCATLDGWLEGAKQVKGSWWPHWTKWLTQYSGTMVAARKPGAKLGIIEDAPGSYVKVKT